jgi:menaquinone-dependent protoporphyrinogen oxidase
VRVLVTYASKHGSTTEVGQRIAAAILKTGVDADALPVRDVGDVARYDAVVMGSSVYFGRWMREAVAFVERNRTRLAGRPIWLFSVGPLGDQPRTDPADVAGLAASLDAVEHHLFTGALDLHRLSFPERVIVKGVKAPTGDFRDWSEIDSWAASIARVLEQSAAPQAQHSRT